MGSAAGDRVGVQGPVEQADPLVDEDVDRSSVAVASSQPARRLLLAREGLGGPHRRRPGERQRRRLGARRRPRAGAAAGAPAAAVARRAFRRTSTLSLAARPRRAPGSGRRRPAGCRRSRTARIRRAGSETRFSRMPRSVVAARCRRAVAARALASGRAASTARAWSGLRGFRFRRGARSGGSTVGRPVRRSLAKRRWSPPS